MPAGPSSACASWSPPPTPAASGGRWLPQVWHSGYLTLTWAGSLGCEAERELDPKGGTRSPASEPWGDWTRAHQNCPEAAPLLVRPVVPLCQPLNRAPAPARALSPSLGVRLLPELKTALPSSGSSLRPCVSQGRPGCGPSQLWALQVVLRPLELPPLLPLPCSCPALPEPAGAGTAEVAAFALRDSASLLRARCSPQGYHQLQAVPLVAG